NYNTNEDTWNHNPLLPQDPYDKATARFWAKFGDDKVTKTSPGQLILITYEISYIFF
ncbi:hypothetical protein Ddye_025400, partial [Dipteronia dyeriana]